MLYTTLNALKKRLGIADDNTDSDAELNLIIERATAMIDSELGFNLAIREVRERVDSNGSKRIYLKNKATEILRIEYTQGFWSIEVDYIDGYIVYLKQKTGKREKNIEILYKTGYETTPAEIEEICLDLCTIFADKQSITGSNSEKLIDKNIKTQKLGELSITYFGENEKKTQTSFESLNPAKNVGVILNKYKSFSGLTSP